MESHPTSFLPRAATQELPHSDIAEEPPNCKKFRKALSGAVDPNLLNAVTSQPSCEISNSSENIRISSLDEGHPTINQIQSQHQFSEQTFNRLPHNKPLQNEEDQNDSEKQSPQNYNQNIQTTNLPQISEESPEGFIKDFPVSKNDSEEDSPKINKWEEHKNTEIIVELPQKKKQNIGSLLGLFQSELFTMDMHITYIFKKEEVGIQDYLINLLYARKIKELDFYLPQLTLMLKERIDNKTLSDLIIRKVEEYPNFGLKVYWMFNGYFEEVIKTKDQKKIEWVTKIWQNIEMRIVNGGMSSISNSDDDSKILQKFLEKKDRADYHHFQVRFIEIITDFSLKLKEVESSVRTDSLKASIGKLNKWIDSRIRSRTFDYETQLQNNFKGIVMPLEGDKEDILVVGLAADLGFVFSTKVRTPIKVAFELIDLQEASEWNEKILPEEETTSSEEKVNSKEIMSSPKESASVPLENQSSKNTHHPKIEQEEEEENENEPENQEQPIIEKTDTIPCPPPSKPQAKQFDRLERLKGITNYAKFAEIERKIAKKKEREIRKKLLDLKLSTPLPHRKTSKMNDNFTDNIFEPPRRRAYSGTWMNQPDEKNEDLTPTFTKSGLEQLIGLKIDEIAFRKSITPKAKKTQFVINKVEQDSMDYFENEFEVIKPQEIEDFKDNTAYIPCEARLEGMGDPFENSADEFEREKSKSRFRNFSTYRLKSFIVKGNDDLRQELMVMQIFRKFQEIFDDENIPLYFRIYEIIITSHNSGLLEYIPNTKSIDNLKKKFPENWNLNIFYRRYFYDHFEEAQKKFAESLAAYSLATYLLQIRDRHNGNILIDNEGHIIHIDFGFLISNYPGGINFERSPFKLTKEYVEILDGIESEIFFYFKSLLIRGFYALRKHVENLCAMIEIMSCGSSYPCFSGGESGLQYLVDRFKACYSEITCVELVEKLISSSVDNYFTRQYDNFQKYSNNIEQ